MRDFDIDSDLKQEKFQSLKLVQGDRGNKIKINIYEDGQPVKLTGCSITAKYKRADGEVVDDGIIENINDNYFYAVMDSNITKVAGTLKMLFTIEKDAVKVSAFLLLADVREGIGEGTGGGEVTVDLSNFYKKSETYSKSQIDSQFKDIAKQTITTEERTKLANLKNYDDTEIKANINNIKTDLGTVELTTTNKDIKGSINEVNEKCKDIANSKVDSQKVRELIADAQLKGTEVDTSSFVRKSQLNNISLLSGNMANVEEFLLDKKILTWDDGQNRNNCIDSATQTGWIVFNEVECEEGDILFLLNNTEKLLGVCNIFLGDGTLSRVGSVSEVSGVAINKNEKYIRICYNNDNNKNVNLFQIKKNTSDLSKFEIFGNVPIISKEEKDNINTRLKDLDIELSRLFNVNIKTNNTIGLYNTLTKEEQFIDSDIYIKTQMSVNGGEVLYITATNLNNYNFKAYIILDSDNEIIASCEGYGDNESIKDLKVEIPANGNKILINSTSQNGIQVKKFTKARIDDIENQVDINKNNIDSLNSLNYENDIKRFVRTQLKNPFKYKSFDKPYVTFCFDDGTNDSDKIASIFKEFNYPMCMSLPPDSLNTMCVGLQSPTNGYSVNMKIKDVATKVVENNGEVLCHSWTPITKDNINDKELLTETFITNVKILRNAGFEVNGIIMAGGTGALDGGLKQGGDIFQYWATIEFDYSDRYGFTEDYFYPRMNLGDTLDLNKNRIDNAIANNKWIIFFGHALQDSGNYTEQNLRAILQYCKDRNVTVVTYKDMYNKFK